MSELRLTGPAYRIQTQRLLIRCWDPLDAQKLKAAVDASIEHLKPWMPWAYNEPTDLQTKIERIRVWRGKFDLGQDFVYGVFDPDEARVLGGSGLHTRVGDEAREIGYWIHKDFINQGFATEVSEALIRVAFEIDRVDRVEIHCEPDNTRSARVPQKLGFTHEATLRKRVSGYGGRKRDSMIWTLLREEYTHNRASQAKIQVFDVIGRQIL